MLPDTGAARPVGEVASTRTRAVRERASDRRRRLAGLCRAGQRRHDVAYFGAGGVVGLDVDESHRSIRADNEHRGTGQSDCALRVDFGQVESERALGGKNVIGLLERNAEPIGQTTRPASAG
jgi:hypothetical protein